MTLADLILQPRVSAPEGNPLLALWEDHQGSAGPEARRLAALLYAWGIPNDNALATIAGHSPIIEIGAGKGYWAALLAAGGVDIVAYDTFDPTWFGGGVPALWFPVSRGGPEQIDEHPDRTLLLCWPPNADPMAEECLAHYRGSRLLYVGEWRRFTGTPRFHDILERDFDILGEVEIPQWEGFQDRLWVLRRRA